MRARRAVGRLWCWCVAVNGGLYLADVHGIRTLGSLGVILADYCELYYYFIILLWSLFIFTCIILPRPSIIFRAGNDSLPLRVMRIQPRRGWSRDAGTPSAILLSHPLPRVAASKPRPPAATTCCCATPAGRYSSPAPLCSTVLYQVRRRTTYTQGRGSSPYQTLRGRLHPA
jgi:hypothetical protein